MKNCSFPEGSQHLTDKITIGLTLDDTTKLNSELNPVLIYSNDIMIAKSNVEIPIIALSIAKDENKTEIDITFSMESFNAKDEFYAKRSLENFGRFVFKYSLEDGSRSSYSILVMFHKEDNEIVYTFVSV